MKIQSFLDFRKATLADLVDSGCHIVYEETEHYSASYEGRDYL